MKKALLVSLLLLAAAPRFVQAEDLVLVDGRYLQVKILEATDKALRVRNLANGGEFWIPWPLIREDDRDRLMVRFGLKEEELETVTTPGVRITTKIGDAFYGVPTQEFTVQTVPEEVTILHGGTKMTLAKKQILQIEWMDIPALEAYTRDQLYEQEFARLQPADDDLEGHLELARFCSTIEHHELAVRHFLEVQKIDDQYRPEFVANQLVRLENLAKNQRIVDAVKNAKREAFFNRHDRALQQLDQILSIEELDPNLRATTELTKESVIKRRWAYFTKKVTKGYFAMMNNKIGVMSRDPKLKLKQAQKEVRTKLHKEIVADLASRYGLDPKKEVEKMWEERVIHAPRVAWYGSGTFVVLGKAPGAEKRNQQLQRQLARAMQEQRRQGGGNDQNGSMGLQSMKLPKPPTKDEWWGKIADSGARASWMKAYYAENGKHLKVVSSDRKNPCSRCGATGSIKFAGAQGEPLPVTCPRCQGHKFDKGVAYK